MSLTIVAQCLPFKFSPSLPAWFNIIIKDAKVIVFPEFPGSCRDGGLEMEEGRVSGSVGSERTLRKGVLFKL